MKKTKITKEDLKSPDSFITLTDKIIHSIEKHKKPLFGVLGLIFLIGAVNVGISFYYKSVEETAAAALYQYKKGIDKKREALKEEQEKSAKKDDKKKEAKVAEEEKMDTEKEYQALDPLFVSYSGEINKHKSTKVGVIAALELANEYISFEKHEKAKEILESVQSSVPKESVLFGLHHSSLGSTYVELNQYDDAIKEFNLVLNNPAQDFLHSEMLLRIGLAYEKQNNFEEAKKAYTRASEEYSESEAAKTAKSYLRLMNIKKGS